MPSVSSDNVLHNKTDEALTLLDVELVDIFTSTRLQGLQVLHRGFLGCSPLHQTVAISLCMLAAYQHIQAQYKTLCHLHDIPYQLYLNTQFSDTYDIYLEILHQVDSIVKAALKRDTPDWHLLNSCPCCSYKVEDEDDMAFEDDLWTYHSDYQLHHVKVDQFQLNGAQPCAKGPADDWEDVVQSALASFNCVDWWKNAGSGAHKHMFSVFDESGIFIAACCHQFILLVCDIVKSGELSKYLLTILDHLLNVYGKNCGVAYDIGSTWDPVLVNSIYE
ncbi:uncharacterized protein F5147DRAFT_744678 [Suillus discolor]|uniref:Uncharacterized protein n=1 Tax=Suillus discolor TaxID=1912936 RepID=A0A9P7FB43_9AGAM|nr:uncharacterized protein F5147DRAFT_744678 [Suillus discolor]KAG2112040.1 hypothetical protein F5147DRAFT_744678 [Suillus discolor]